MIELRAIKGKTGRLIETLLREKGLKVNEGKPTCIVSYGVPVKSELPTLNERAGRLNKYEELVQLQKCGVPTPRFGLDHTKLKGVMLGRKFKHARGRDIVLVSQHSQGIKGSNFFTELIHKEREFRLWVFRNRVLGVYMKQLRYPKRDKGPLKNLVWNWKHGYAFVFCRNAPEALNQVAVDAIRALDLDFGAVDIVEQDEKYSVLEVNTAPGVIDRRQGITWLAAKIQRWMDGGFKKRTQFKEKKAA